MENLEDRVTPTIFTVDTIADAGIGSFRQAIIDANNASSADSIVFDTSGVFATPQTISLQTALPQITSAGGALTITGTGAANLTIRRDPALGTNFRVLDSAAPTLTLTGFTVSNGISAADGGGISIGSGTTCTLDGMLITGNQTTGTNDGAGINVGSGGFLMVRNSTISGNTSGTDGGGIYFFSGGGLVVENSTISGNVANGTTAGGGGIYFFGTASATPPAGFTPSTIVVRNSTISGNNTAANGGGITLPSFTGTLLVQNSTIAGNTATLSGGGIAQTSGGGSIRLENSTVAGNRSNATTATTGGGGIGRITTSAGSVSVANSVVSGNTLQNAGASGPDILSSATTTTNVNFSLVGTSTGFTPSGTSGNNLPAGTDPQLGALGNNGGPTQTMLPADGSPLVGAGSNALLPTGSPWDQRGFGYVRNFNSTADIGAVEVQPPGLPVAQASAADVSTPGGTSYTFTVLVADPTGSNNGINVGSIINNNSAVHVTGPGGIDLPATYVSIDNSANGTPRTATFSITPPGGSWDGSDNGPYSLVIQGSQVADIDGNFVQAGSVGSFTVLLPMTVTVTNADDSGTGSLRDAIAVVNASPSNDTIVFSSYFNTPRTISLLTALPQFPAAGGTLTISGPGAGNLTVRRDSGAATPFRVFDSATPTLSISDLTIAGGVGTTGGGIQSNAANAVISLSGVTFNGNSATTSGGALYVTGTNALATLTNSTFTGNWSAGSGGGVFMASGTFLSVQSSTINNNAAAANGGGVHLVGGGGLVVNNSSISGNSAGASIGGGGIYFPGTASASPPAGFTASTVVVRNSTISNNASGSAGGGIVLSTFASTLSVVNSTLSGNTAATSGGAIAQVSGAGSVSVVNSTIAGNTANATAANTGGGGIARTSTTAGTVTVANTVVSGNTSANAPDIVTGASGTTVNVNFSAVGSPVGFTPSGSSGNNLAFGTNPLLGPLANYGGPNRAMSPLPGSPLVGAGSDALIPSGVTTDQRGGSFARSSGGTVDIGAIESQAPFIPIAIATSADIADSGSSTYQFTVTYSDPTGTNNGINTTGIVGNNSAVRVTGPNGFSALATFVSIDNSGNGTPRTATYTISTPGGSWDPTDNGLYTVSTQTNQVADLDGNFVVADVAGSFLVSTPIVVTNDNNSGAGSLRVAIEQANAVPISDRIFFSSFFDTPRTISLLTALPQFAGVGGLTIVGPGAANLTVTRAAAAPAFRIFDSAAPTLNMSGITVSGGIGTTGGGLQQIAANSVLNLSGLRFNGNTATTNGGGLYVTGTNALATVTNSTFANNLVSGSGNGGAVFMDSSTFLSLQNSAVTGNTAAADGGGLYFFSGGGLVVDNSTISGNTSGTVSVGGGALYFFGTASATPPPGFTASTVVIRNSTISNNLTGLTGGGIVLPTFTGTLLVQNSTITGNTSGTSGGGINALSGSGSITVVNSTIVGNTSLGTVPGVGGGGIARSSTTAGNITVANSVVSGNTNVIGPDILSSANTTTNVNFSLVGSNTGFTLSGTSGDNLAFGTDPLLGPLANYGGPTRTMAPLPGSPLVGAGSDALIPSGVTTDQRGGSFARSSGGTVDIGSVESQSPFIPIALANAANVTTAGNPTYQFTVTYSDPTGTNNGINTSGIIGNNSVVLVTGPNGFSALATFVSIDNSGNGTPRTATYTISTPGGSWDPTDNGLYTVSTLANQVADLDGNFVAADLAGTFTVISPYIVTTDADAGTGSLREAVIAATASGVADAIAFSPTFFNVPRTISLLTALPTFATAGGPLTINGPGSTVLTVRRNPGAANFRVLDSTAPTLTLSGFTVSGGNVAGNGAGLQTAGIITLDSMVFTGNQTTGSTGDGGAIRVNSPGFLRLRNSTLSGNTAARNGGGISFVSGTSLLMENSTITGNTASGTAANQGGGGIYFTGTVAATAIPGFVPSTLVIRNSTIDTNVSTSFGGGVQLMTFAGTLLVQNSTISGNTATGTGGGISQSAGAGGITVQNSTISGNTSNTAAAGQGGGGIARTSPTAGTINVLNSIVSGNTNTNGPDILAPSGSNTVNVNFSAIGSATGYTPSGTSGNNLPFATNLLLGPLADNGGLTRTRAPQPTSPLIDAGDNASIPAGLTTDQRGGALVRLFGSAVDIGSFEVQPPTVAINQAPGQADPANAEPISFAVAFNVPVTDFTGSDISFAGSTVGGTLVANVTGSGANYTVSVTGMSGVGTVVASIPAGVAVDGSQSGNLASSSTDNTVLFDNVAPTLTINQAAGQADPTNTGPITFDVVFNEPVTGFTGSDVSFAGSTVGGTLVANVSGSGTNYTVTVTGMDGAGTVIATVPAGGAADAAGNSNSTSTSSDNTVLFDNVPPTVTIDQAAGQADPTNTGPITFDVVFSEPVTDFTAADVSLAGSTVGGTLVTNVSGSGTTYTVTVTGMNGTGNLIASIPAGGVFDVAGNVNAASTSTDNTVLFDNESPDVTINQSAAQADPTNVSPITFDVVFDEPVTGFDASDVSFAGSTVGGTLQALVSGLGPNYTVTVTGMDGEGNVVVSIPAGAAGDIVGNPSFASTSTDNSVHFDNVAPTVTIDQAAGQVDPTNASPITFNVVFSEAVTGFTASDISLAGSTVGGTLVANVLGNGTTYTVTVTGMNGTGTVIASIPAAAAADLTGNASTASTSSDNTVVFDNVVPTVTIDQAAGQVDPTNAAPITFNVLFSEPVTGFTASDISLAGSTVGGTLVANVIGTGASYTVTVTGMDGVGTVVASIPGGAASDAAGNVSDESTSTDNTVAFDNVAPTVTIEQAAGQIDPTSAPAITYTVHFSEPVSGFTASDISFAGSTVGGTLQANVTGSGADYTVTVNGMFGIGTVVASIPAGAASDVATNTNVASTSSDNTVTYDNIGHLGLDASVVNVNEADGIATITVSRLNGTDGAISIDYATSPNTAHANDFTATTGTLSWADGEGGTKSFTIDLTNDPANEGRENFNITLSNLVGVVHPELFASQVSIAPSDPKGPGIFFDQDGDKVTLKLTGGGTLGYYLTDWDGDGKGPIELIELANTTPLSVVNLSVLKATATTTDGGRIGLGEVTGTGVKAFNAKLANLNGPGINLNGYLGALVIGDVQNGADIRALGTATQKTRITAGVIGDGTDIDVDASLAALMATKIGVGLITAPSIGTMTVKGNVLQHIVGDMGSDVAVSGVGVVAGVPAVKVLKVTGSVPVGADITAPSIGSLIVIGDLASDVTVSGVGMPTGKYAINVFKVVKSVLPGVDITAPSIGTLTVTGNMAGDVNLSGTGLLAGQPALRVFTVVGSVASDIQVGGRMTTVVTGGFNGTLTAASVGTMTVKGNLNGDVTFTGTGLAAGKVALPLLTVTGSILGGAISAPNAGTITVKGNMSGDLNLAGPAPATGKPVLSALKVTGAVSGSDIRVGGDITTVLANSFRDSTLFAGYTGLDDGSGVFNVPAVVSSFKVTGLTDAFANSTVIASTFKNVTLQSVKGDNGGDKFGFIADLFYLVLKVATPPFVYDIANQGPQGFGDFVVKLV